MSLQLAGGIIQDKSGRVLLLHRNTPKRTQWEIPGGKIEADESAEDAAVREIQEELGVAVNIVKKLGEKEFTEDDFTMHYIWFLVELITGQPEIKEPETFDDLQYFSIDELKQAKDLSPNTQNFLTDLTSKQFSLLPDR